MDWPFALIAPVWLIGMIALALLMLRLRVASVILFAVALVVLPWLADTATWYTWFAWAKRYALVVPVCLWAWLVLRTKDQEQIPASVRWIMFIGPIIVILNIILVAAKQLEYGFYANGVFLIALALLTPWRMSRDPRSGLIGFQSWPWVIAYTSSLLSFYALDRDFANLTFGAITMLALSLGVCLVARDTRVWMTWRLYTLAILAHQDSMLNSLSDRLYPPWLHPESRQILKGTLFEYGLLVITGVCVGMLAVRRFRDLSQRGAQSNVVAKCRRQLLGKLDRLITKPR